jgi:hypothetical protein
MYVVTWFNLLQQVRKEVELEFIWEVESCVSNLEKSSFNVDIEWWCKV